MLGSWERSVTFSTGLTACWYDGGGSRTSSIWFAAMYSMSRHYTHRHTQTWIHVEHETDLL